MTIEHNEKVEQLPTSNVVTNDEAVYRKDEQSLKQRSSEAKLEDTIQKNVTISRSDSIINQKQKATVRITANYVFKKNRKGGGKLLIDRDTVAGELVISSSNQATDDDTIIPLTIEKFKVSDNFKKVSYKTTTSKNERAVSCKVSGVLRLQDSAELAISNDKEHQQAFSNLQRKKGNIKVKLGRSVYNSKNSSASVFFTET